MGKDIDFISSEFKVMGFDGMDGLCKTIWIILAIIFFLVSFFLFRICLCFLQEIGT